MWYEWDRQKARANASKHGIRFADAVSVFSDERLLLVPDPHPDEDRHVGTGLDLFGRILVVVFTWRGEDTIRLISARKATRRERRQYGQRER